MAPRLKQHIDNNQNNDRENHDEGNRERSKGKKDGKRGPTQLKKIVKNKVVGKKIKVNCNEHYQSVGKGGKTLMSYLGVLVRSLVPINIKTWHHVKDDKRDKIWTEANLAFDIDKNISRDYIMQRAGKQWKEFKTNLTKNHIQCYINDSKLLDEYPDALDEPPTDYPEIEKEHWTDFVNSRMTKEFQEYRKKQQERHAQLKYPHHMARKGYANLEDEIKQLLGIKTPRERGELWLLGRQNKNGEFVDDETRAIANRIDELRKLRDAGEIQEIGSNDILTQALGTPEHSGIVRGRGHGVKPKEYFKRPIGGMRELQEQQIRYEKEILARLEARYDARFQRLEAIIGGKVVKSKEAAEETAVPGNSAGDHVSPQEVVGETMVDREDNGPMKGVKCKLAVDNVSNIVAEGHIIAMSGVIHGRDLGESNHRVSVDKIIHGKAQLPVPVLDEMSFVQDAFGSHVAWPRHLVILENSQGQPEKCPLRKNSISPNETQKRKSASPEEPETQPQEKEKACPPTKPTESSSSSARPDIVSTKALFEIPPDLPKALKILAKSIRKKDLQYLINIPLEENFFGEVDFLNVAIEDIKHIILLEEISATCVAVYMRYLYTNLVEEERLHLFGFIHPATLTTFTDDIEKRAKSISAQMLARKAQFWLAPYNSGRHWTLLAIDMRIEVVHYFDSLRGVRGENVDSIDDIQKVMRMALLIYNSEKKKVGRSKLAWSPVICPRQPDGIQCGYYVMRYMKELVSTPKPIEYINSHCNKKKTYIRKEIDEIRDEWTDCVTDYL